MNLIIHASQEDRLKDYYERTTKRKNTFVLEQSLMGEPLNRQQLLAYMAVLRNPTPEAQEAERKRAAEWADYFENHDPLVQRCKLQLARIEFVSVLACRTRKL